MAEKMPRKKQEEWLKAIEKYLGSDVELPKEFLYAPEELSQLQTSLAKRILAYSNQMEQMERELERKNLPDLLKKFEGFRKRQEEGLLVMAVLARVVMQQKHELVALQNLVGKLEARKK